MKINWKVRVTNWQFWVRVAVGFALPVLAYFGLSWENFTSWAMIGQTLLETISNPYVFVLGIIGAVNAIPDPTTPGVSDSTYALGKTALK